MSELKTNQCLPLSTAASYVIMTNITDHDLKSITKFISDFTSNTNQSNLI